MRIGAIRAECASIFQNKGNLDDSCCSSSHQGISKDCVDHAAEMQGLWMRRHGVPGQQDDNCGNEVALRTTVPLTAQPDPQKTGAPPDNAHSRVLQIVVNPWTAPAMLSKSVNTAPGGNDERVEEFLAPAGATQPVLTDQEEDGQQDSVSDKRTSHNEMCEALAEMVAATETQSSDATKEHLHPADHRHQLADDTVTDDDESTDPAMNTLGEMKLEIDTQDNLENHHKHEGVGK